MLITTFVTWDMSANTSEENVVIALICKGHTEEERCEPGIREKASFV